MISFLGLVGKAFIVTLYQLLIVGGRFRIKRANPRGHGRPKLGDDIATRRRRRHGRGGFAQDLSLLFDNLNTFVIINRSAVTVGAIIMCARPLGLQWCDDGVVVVGLFL